MQKKCFGMLELLREMDICLEHLAHYTFYAYPATTVIYIGQFVVLSSLLAFQNFQAGIRACCTLSLIGNMRMMLTILIVPRYVDAFGKDRETLILGTKGISLTPLTVLLSKLLLVCLINLPIVFIVTAIIYPIVGLRGPFWRPICFLILLYIHTITLSILGLMISALSRKGYIRRIILAPFMLINIWLSGQSLPVDIIPSQLKWLQYLSASFYTTFLAAKLQFSGFEWKIEGEVIAKGENVLCRWQGLYNPIPWLVATGLLMTHAIGYFLIALLGLYLTSK